VTFLSSVFEPLGRAQSEALGYGNLRILTIPHPIATRPDAELFAIGQDLVGEVLRALGGQEKAEQE
jgi:hypothetical protein